jgi:hypothetical protein
MPPKKKVKKEAVPPAPVATYDRSNHCSSQPDGSWKMEVAGTRFRDATKVIYYQYKDAPQQLDYLLNMHPMHHFHVLVDPEANDTKLQPPPSSDSCSVLWRCNVEVLYITTSESDLVETKLDPPLVPKTKYIHSLHKDTLVTILKWIAFFPVGQLTIILFVPRTHMVNDSCYHTWNIVSSIAGACSQPTTPSEAGMEIVSIPNEAIPPAYDPKKNEYLIRFDVITTISSDDLYAIAMSLKRTKMIPVLWDLVCSYI